MLLRMCLASVLATLPGHIVFGAEAEPDKRPVDREQDVPEVSFDRVALSDVADTYRDLFKRDVVINWEFLGRIGVRPTTTVSYHAKHVTLERALKGTLAAVDARLIVEPAHGAYFITSKDDPARLNSMVQVPGDEARPENQAVCRAMDRQIPEVKFEHMSVADVLDRINQKMVPLSVDWNALKSAGVDRTTKVDLVLNHARGSDVIFWVLHGLNGKLPVACMVQGGRVVVSTIPELERRRGG